MIAAKFHEIWRRDSKSDGGYTYSIVVKVAIPAKPGDDFTFPVESFGGVEISTFRQGPRGGFGSSPGLGLSAQEWDEINARRDSILTETVEI